MADPGGPYQGAVGAAIGFTGTGSTDPDGDGLSYAWDFGDGSSGTGATPAHSYAVEGSYTVTLTVSDGRGGSDQEVTTATIATGRQVLEIRIVPGTQRQPIRLSDRGQPTIAVIILTTPTFDAAQVAPSSLTLGDRAGAGTPVATRQGRPLAELADIDDDGDMDLVASFNKQQMRNNGDLSARTTRLVLLGELTDGRRLRAARGVRVVR